MSRKQNLALEALARHLGLEDEDGSPIKGEEIEVAEDGAPIKGDETVEAEELAVDQASDEANAELDAGDDLVEAEQTLESIYKQLVSASEAGRGISEESARFMQLAIEGITIKGHRLSLGKVGIPSCESFGSSNRALSNTNLSMEGVGEVLRRVWTWIKEQVTKIVAKIKNWYKSVLGLAPRLKKRAEAIKKKADGTSGSTDESTVELSVHKQLVIEKKAPTPQEAVTALEVVADIAKNVLSVGGPVGSKVADAMIDELNSLDSSTVTDWNEVEQGLFELSIGRTGAAFFTNGKAVEAGRFGDDVEALGSKPVFGNKAFFAVGKKTIKITDADSFKKIVNSTKLGYDALYKKTPETDSTADYKVMTTGNVSDICDSVIDICDYVQDYEKKWQDREKYGKKIQEAAEKAGKRFEKDKQMAADVTRDLKAIAMATYNVWSMGIRTESNVVGYSMGASRALLTWCERSLSTYKA